MKKLINIFSIAVIAIAISGTVSSCKKDDKKADSKEGDKQTK
jgi:hypothetical protein